MFTMYVLRGNLNVLICIIIFVNKIFTIRKVQGKLVLVRTIYYYLFIENNYVISRHFDLIFFFILVSLFFCTFLN